MSIFDFLHSIFSDPQPNCCLTYNLFFTNKLHFYIVMFDEFYFMLFFLF